MSVTVAPERLEQARAVMIELFPEGFEEVDLEGEVELAVYTNSGGEERVWHVFGGGTARDVEPGWEDRWRRFHRPVRVGDVWVGPPWEQPDEGILAVVIDPGRAFGTGGHATTRLCLELLQRERPGSLVDVGCGSGVLAIAAAKLGFAPILGLDVDALAIEATRLNAEANGVTVQVALADALGAALPEADLTVANIALEPAVALGPLLRSPRAITSGYLASDRPRLAGYRPDTRLERDGWAADVHVRE